MANVGYKDNPPPYSALYCSQEHLVDPAPMPQIRAEQRNVSYPLTSLASEDIYEACIQYVNEHLFYSSKFVEQMALTDIVNGAAYHYTLETFVEKRETAGSITPYSGQPIDGPENGLPPAAWDIVVNPPTALFLDNQLTVEIPHTASVSFCLVCVGIGRVRCEFCSGEGGHRCVFCFGRGRRQNRRCFHCRGSGRRRCEKCVGNGQICCMTCSGYGKTKYCEVIKVMWTNHKDEFISDTCNLPPKECKKVTGKCLLSEEKEEVYPIIDAADPSIRHESARLIESHRVRYQNQRRLKQRQTLVAIPLSKVMYKWKTKEGEFYVFGEENKIYFQDYPQKCCCCTCF